MLAPDRFGRLNPHPTHSTMLSFATTIVPFVLVFAHFALDLLVATLWPIVDSYQTRDVSHPGPPFCLPILYSLPMAPLAALENLPQFWPLLHVSILFGAPSIIRGFLNNLTRRGYKTFVLITRYEFYPMFKGFDEGNSYT